jgi:maltooligosyltrehalose trehalohydrolase
MAERPDIDPDLLAIGMDGQWADDLHHSLHAFLTRERAGYYAAYGHLEDLAAAISSPARVGIPYRRVVVFDQNHDQVGNRARGERLSQLVGPRQLRAAAALVICSGFVPLLFMGEEWGATTPFLFFSDHRDPAIARATTEGRPGSSRPPGGKERCRTHRIRPPSPAPGWIGRGRNGADTGSCWPGTAT